MSDRFPACSQIDSNNSGINVSIPTFNRRISSRVVDYSVRFFSPLQTVEMSASSMQGDASASRNYAPDVDVSPQRRPEVGDQIPSSPSSNHEVSGAMIEVITVEKYKRSDGFANPYHIQGLNASTPDDVDDDDDEEEEDGVGQIPDRERSDSSTTVSKHENTELVTHDDDQIEETVLKKDVDEEDSVRISNKDLRSKHPSIPTSAESTVSSESPCHSNTSSVVPSQSAMAAPRSDSVGSGVGQPRLFKFTVERVPSSDSNNDQTPTAESQTAHITPPVSVSRAPTSDSIFVSEVPSDSVSVDEPLSDAPTSQTADVIHPTRAPWIPQDYPRAGPTGTELPAQMSHWASAEMAAAAAATAAVASAVVNPVVSSQDSQAMAMGQSNQPHFNIAVAAASAAVAAINNMMIDPNLQPSNVQPDLSAFGHHHKPSILNPELPGISGYSPYGQPDVMYQHHSSSIPPSTVSAVDRVSTPSPGPPTQSSVATPPPSDDSRTLTAGAVDTRTEIENDEGEIRFRRARYLEKRERWHDKRFLVVDTFRREEPVSRPEVKLPDPTYPLNCKRCLKGTKSSQVKVRPCPCSSESAATLQQWTDRHRYSDHAENHGFIPNKNKHKADNNFGYPETIVIMERATQLAYRTSLAASLASPRGSSCEIDSNVEAVGKAAAAAAAVAASFSNSGGREPNLACSAPSPTSIPNVTLRRKGLQRNNSHFHLARSSPSSFSANEIQPQVDHVAAMAVAAVVSVTAAMANNDRRERGLHSERSSETEHPINPPTSPASGHTRDSLNRSSSVPEVTSLNSKTTLPSVDNRTFPVNNNSAERNSASDEGSSKTSATTVTQGPAMERNVSQANSLTTGAMSSSVDQQVSTTSSAVPNGRHNDRQTSDGHLHAEPSDDKVKQNAPPESYGSVPSQTSPQSSSAIHSISNIQTIPEQSYVSQSSQHSAIMAANEGHVPAAQIPESTAPPAVIDNQMETTVPPQSQTSKPKKSPKVQLPSSANLQHSVASASGSGMVSTGSMGTTEPYKLSQATSSGTPQSIASDMSAAAAYVAHGLMMSNPLHSGSGVPLMPGEPGVISAAPNVSSNTSSMNYLDQYRMQHILPVGPSASSSAAPEPPRQTTEARIAQSLDHVRLAMISYFRELEDKHTYQIKSLQEEVRQLREQRERDLAIIREYVPHECLLQLGHPYSSLAKVSAPQSSRSTVQNSMNSTAANSTIQQSQMSQATDPSASTPASQSHLHSMHSTQPPSQQPE